MIEVNEAKNTMSTKYPDGTQIIIFDDGCKIETFADGRKMQHNPDGGTIESFPSGHKYKKIQRNQNGSWIEFFSGTLLFAKPRPQKSYLSLIPVSMPDPMTQQDFQPRFCLF